MKSKETALFFSEQRAHVQAEEGVFKDDDFIRTLKICMVGDVQSLDS